MKNKINCVGILTSGGDAPGMNAGIRAVTRAALYHGIKVKGIYRGYKGLITGEIKEFKTEDVSNIIQRGGTILKTSRCDEFKTEEGRATGYATLQKEGIDALVVIGGDGSITGAYNLAREYDIPCIALPGTIDNDLYGTDTTIGYDTATNTVVDLVDKLRDTCASHDRCSVVEVMGRHAGWLALGAGIAAGATSIIVPEVPYDFQKDIVDRMNYTKSLGKSHFIVMVAEGIGDVDQLAKNIEAATGVETRATVLGHVQRGGRPSARDRILASQMGYYAAHLLMEGKTERVVAVNNNQLMDYDIDEALAIKKPFKDQLFRMAEEINI